MDIHLKKETTKEISDIIKKQLIDAQLGFTCSSPSVISLDKPADISFLPVGWIEKIDIKPRRHGLYEALFLQPEPVFIAGPCSVEDRDMILNLARQVKEAGATVLRGGSYKVRTSAFSFQGLGKIGLEYLYEAGKASNLPIISEMTDVSQATIFHEWVDIIQIGARNMQNFPLIESAASLEKPILIKRGPGATLFEYIKAIEYAYIKGNGDIILCERGIRSFEHATRYTLDISAIPILQQETKLPVIVDPSHGTGHSHLIKPMALAGMAAGAKGLMIEVHENPNEAKSDKNQLITPIQLEEIIQKSRMIQEIQQLTFSPRGIP